MSNELLPKPGNKGVDRSAEKQKPWAPHVIAWSILALLLFCWLRTLPWRGNALWGTHNKLFDVQRALGVVDAWRAGLWDARWFQNFDQGYGYPFLLYYAPLFHWISGGLTLLLGSSVLALQYNLAFWLIAGTAGMYLAGNQLWGQTAPALECSCVPGFVAACGWLMSPYLMCNVFVRGTLSEFASSQTLPWLVYLALRHFSGGGGSIGTLLATTTVLSLAILTHNFLGLCALLFCGWLLGGALLEAVVQGRASNKDFVRAAGGWGVAIALALACTAFFWAPALLDQKYVNIKEILRYRYSNHFLYWYNLARLNYWDYGVSGPGPLDTMPLHLGYVSLLAACSGLSGLACAWFSGQSRVGWTIYLLLGSSIVAVLMTTWISRPLWDRFSLLQYGQFPWRLLSFGALGCSLLLPSIFVASEASATKKIREFAAPVLLLVLVGCSAWSQKQYGRINAAFDVSDEIASGMWRKTAVTSTERNEYEPIWSVGKARSGSSPGQIIVPPQLRVAARDEEALPAEWRWRVENSSAAPANLTVALNYFPAWKAWDMTRGRRLEVAPEQSTGFLQVMGVAPGASEVRLRFGNTPVRQVAWGASLGGVLLFLWVSGAGIVRLKTGQSRRAASERTIRDKIVAGT